MIRSLLAVLCLACASSCASLQETDRSYVNHKAMDLNRKAVPPVTGRETRLDSILGGGGSGECKTCAR